MSLFCCCDCNKISEPPIFLPHLLYSTLLNTLTRTHTHTHTYTHTHPVTHSFTLQNSWEPNDFISLSLLLKILHVVTHTHTHREREREHKTDVYLICLADHGRILLFTQTHYYVSSDNKLCSAFKFFKLIYHWWFAAQQQKRTSSNSTNLCGYHTCQVSSGNWQVSADC